MADIIALMRHHLDRNRRTTPQDVPTVQQAAQPALPRSSGPQVIYREATDNDDWW